MTLPNYGIPDVDAATQALAQGISQNDTDLEQVAVAAATPLVSATQANAQALGSVANTANRSLAGSVGANTRSLNQVSGVLAQSYGPPVQYPAAYNPGGPGVDVTGTAAPAYDPSQGPPSYITVNGQQIPLSGAYGQAGAFYHVPGGNTIYTVYPQSGTTQYQHGYPSGTPSPTSPPPAQSPAAVPPAPAPNPQPQQQPSPPSSGIGPLPPSPIPSPTSPPPCSTVSTPPVLASNDMSAGSVALLHQPPLVTFQGNPIVGTIMSCTAGGGPDGSQPVWINVDQSTMFSWLDGQHNPPIPPGTQPAVHDGSGNLVCASAGWSLGQYAVLNGSGFQACFPPTGGSPPSALPPPALPPASLPPPTTTPPPATSPPPPPECIPICLVPPPGSSPPPGSPPGSPPSPPAPVVPPAPIQIQPQPPVLGTFDLVIPLPGTDAWCKAAPYIQTWLITTGNVVYGFIDKQLNDYQTLLLTLAQPPDSSEWSVFGTIFTGILRDIVAPIENLTADVIGALRLIIVTLRTAITIGPTTNTPLIAGIMAAKGLWNAVKNFKFGSETWTLSKTTLGNILPELDTVFRYISNEIMPLHVPSPSEAMESFLQGLITQDVYNCWLLINGCNPDTYAPILAARRDRLTTTELIEYGRRNGVPDDQIAASMRNIGWLNSNEASARVTLYDELPSIADVLHFLTRNVDHLSYVKDYGLLDGFATDDFIDTIPGFLGYTTTTDTGDRNFWGSFGDVLHAQGMTAQWAAYHYAAHWVNPAPTQMRDFLYRLRPGKEGVAHPFTITDFKRLMAEQDIAPRAAQWFADTAYHVPALGYLRDMYRQYVISDADMVSYHQDLGYTEQDSTRFLAIDKIVRDRQRASQSHGWTPAAIASAYAVEILTADSVIAKMDALGYDEDEANELMERANAELQRTVFVRARARALTSTITEVKSAIRVGVITQDQAEQTLRQAGWPALYAANLVNTEMLSARTAQINQIVSAVRKAYLRGEVDQEAASGLLSQAGILPNPVADYLTIWALQQTPNRKRRTASQIVNDVANGYLTSEDALVRLINLGYDNADSMLYLADAQAKITNRQAKMIAQGQRADKATQAALAKEALLAQRQARAAVKRLEKIAPVAKLQKWAKLGIIGHDLFSTRMKLYGYDPATIEDYYKEACDGKTAACVETTPNGTTIGTGEPGVPGP